MAVTLSGAGGLFTRWGKLAKVLYGAHQFAGGNLLSYTNDAIAALGSEYALQSPLPTALTVAQQNASQIGYTLQQQMREVLVTMVNADTPQADRGSVLLAMTELIRQMKTAGASVPACTVTITSAPASGNSGNGVVVASVLRGDGLTQQNAFAETGELRCISDAQSGGATGSEQWLWTGDYSTSNPLDYTWPGFSGSQAGLQTIDSQSANLITNGGFDAFTVTDVPDGWTVSGGTVTTNYGKELSVVHRGGAAFKIIGDNTAVVTLEQTFAAGVLRPDTLYAVNLWMRVSTAPAAGQLSIKLVDGGGATVADDQTANNAYLSPLITNTTYAATNYVFRTPRVLPATVKLQLQVTGPLSSAKTLYLDSLAMRDMNALYQGGPALAVFAGTSPWIANDRHLVTVANNRNGASYGATWQTALDRFFDMKSMNLIAPYSGSPTLADSLLTA